ncbi:uncharacterized protein LOC119999403 isoform X2 [Tripterygium wilfordii]|uniref:uncharacterized protein LOC119999403 isoform X2 n=1 Tax=Tripterygium wilfordii TaxID=458696 RepID=UPI0018F7E694|nr:uncharacterized protein LOC119999403 isoform X2 [Tripterygium wilfordii]
MLSRWINVFVYFDRSIQTIEVEKKAWVKGLISSHASSRLQCKLDIQRNWVRNLCFSGSRLNIGSILRVSVIIGSFSFSPQVAYAMDDCGILEDDYRVDLSGASDVEEDQRAIRAFVRKLWLPVLFFFTVLVSWDHPIALASKVILFLLSTKPNPLSVYVFVEQLCHQYKRQDPRLYGSKSLYASKVEVQDYKILCVARVVISNQRFTLVGILGGWWALPLSSGLFSALRDSSSIHPRKSLFGYS